MLIKDNHIALCGGVTRALELAGRNLPPRTRVEIEVSTAGELDEALKAGADVILIDNTTTDELRAALEKAGTAAAIEVSGGITADNILEMASTGVPMISLGAITHSAKAVDISLNFRR